MTQFIYHLFPYNSDNCGVLIHDPETGKTGCVDTDNEGATLKILEQKGWTLSEIWITHHHWDHTDGLPKLKAATGAHVIGPKPVAGSKAIDGIDTHYGDGDEFSFAGQVVKVMRTPGHTLDMINFYLPGEGVLFTGDTLFAMGCGRLFEGTPGQMFDSMNKLKALPESTTIYCSHEYTLANAVFAKTIEPNNAALLARLEQVKAQRERGEPTVPTTLGEELATNPYLRCGSADIRNNLDLKEADDLAVFTKIRKLKDSA